MILGYFLVAWWHFRWLNTVFIVLVSGALWLFTKHGISSSNCLTLITLAGLVMFLTIINATKSVWLTIYIMSCDHVLITLSGPLLYPIFQRLAEL